ncbi:hypothetical protein X751_16380 [Mesorhizobium sp. LNJC395A00]|nr:hypothetical protein X751_16380 [Mesorhizobium sp. LNJC395A00]
MRCPVDRAALLLLLGLPRKELGLAAFGAFEVLGRLAIGKPLVALGPLDRLDLFLGKTTYIASSSSLVRAVKLLAFAACCCSVSARDMRPRPLSV